METPSPSAKLYPVVKISIVVDALVEEGVPMEQALADSGLTRAALESPGARVSLNQVIACYRQAMRLTRDPQFAFRTGLKFHLATYGLFGFAMLCSPSYRETLQFAVRYHRLATPVVDLEVVEDATLTRWMIKPLAHPLVDVDLYRFLVELHCGILTTLHRDVMGPTFEATEVQVVFPAPPHAAQYPAVFGCPVLFGQPQNMFAYDRARVDRPAEFGNRVVFPTVVALCDALLKELECREGVAGKVRQALLASAPAPGDFAAIAKGLGMSDRSLRRRLAEESTSFRKLTDELRAEMAVRYLRQTDLTLHEISHTLGFSEPAAFRRAFRRWTREAPSRFRSRRAPRLGAQKPPVPPA
jgi:AraC-like DNA-binding protein